MDILIVGSIALDDVKTPAGQVKDALGGSATYASLAASYFARPGVVGVVGRDFSDAHVSLLQKHGVDVSGLEKTQGETFHWAGRYEGDMSTAITEDTRLNVFATFDPKVPAIGARAPFVFLANIDPVLQAKVLDQIQSPKFVLLDTMNLWIETKREALLDVLRRVDMVVVNDAEARQLSGESNLIRAAQWIRSQGPRGVALKKGEHGALIFWEDSFGVLPAFPLAEVKDPTGAGDTFAGGLIGSLAQTGELSAASLKSSAAVGSVMAAFTVEAFSADRLAKLESREIKERYARLQDLMQLQSFAWKVSQP